jgi:TatD DNase family protein
LRVYTNFTSLLKNTYNIVLIDTHTHLYSREFDTDRASMIERAIHAGVTKFYLPNVDSESIQGMLDLEVKYPNNCFAMMGLHPCSVKENYKAELRIVETWLEKRAFCAIGEIGIDLYWDKTFFEEQKIAFIQQLDWAQELGIPVSIHARQSTLEILDILRAKPEYKQGGIFHCFGGSAERAKELIDLGFYLGIGGVLTYKKSGLDESLKDVDLNYLVLETDAPYLSPIPFRGKRNESSYIPYIAQKLAEVKGIDIQKVAEVTTRNANIIFSKMSKIKPTIA